MKTSFFAAGISSVLLTSVFHFAPSSSGAETRAKGPTRVIGQNLSSKRYWQHAMRPLLPKDWVVASVQNVAAPEGWTRTSGGNGIAVRCNNSKVVVRNRLVGSYQPSVILSVMPNDWEGQSPREQGEYLRGGKYTVKQLDKGMFEVRQIYPARYLGHNQLDSRTAGHFFGSITGHPGWNDPNEAITRHFKLVVDQSR